MVRVAIVDDHPAIRLGLNGALRAEPGLVPVGAVESAEALEPLLYRAQPDVVLLDYHLPGRDGLEACRELKAHALAPAVVLYSAFADPSLTLPAIVARADGIVHKGAPARELFAAIRTVAAGGSALPPVTEDQLETARALLPTEALPLVGLLIRRKSPREIAATLRVTPTELRDQIEAILARLRSRAPSAATGPPGAQTDDGF
jgi:DNA-binding NarL/FixJ family response regulator